MLVANKVGATGSGVRAVVSSAPTTNKIIVDNVSDNFTSSSGAVTYLNSSGCATTLTQPTAVITDSVRDGITMMVDHHNHGMHAATNKVDISGVLSDVAPTTLTASIDDNTSIISVADGTAFTTFEGAAVGNSNPGYILVNKEIISYKTISGNNITIDTRVVDSSLKSTHAQGANVYKYEFNGVSLRKINKLHDLDPRERTFNSYHIALSDTTKKFTTSKVGGGDKVHTTKYSF